MPSRGPAAAPPELHPILRWDDASRTLGAASSGPVRLLPAAVALPRDTEDVRTLVRWAEAEGIALVPRGAGTGMPGGNVGRGVVVDLSRFDRAGEPDASEGRPTIAVGAGVVASRVVEISRSADLFLPPLPSSADRCTIGGMIANNAAGARTFRHGAVREWVEEIELVGAGGEVFRLRRGHPSPWCDGLHRSLSARLGARPDPWPHVRKNSSGYPLDRFLPGGDALQLAIGSEGTLGIVTGAVLRLAPEPESRVVSLLAVRDPSALVDVARTVTALEASACELLGRRLVEMAGLEADPRFGTLARDAVALVLVELEGDRDAVARALPELGRLAQSQGSALLVARDATEAHALWDLRHRASPSIARAADRGLRSTQFIEDSVVPVERLPAYLEGVGDILAQASTDAALFGHLGDGNIHVNPLVDLGRTDWRDTVREIMRQTVDLVTALGGTLSGEHGDGRVRAPWLDRVWGGRLAEAFREVAATLDPNGIFNPGVIVPLPGQDPLDGMWADPTEDLTEGAPRPR